MYPHKFFNLFPPFPRENKVFVAMDFDNRFDNRWEKIIKPAVESIKHKEISLEPYRADIRKISDSILTDILIGIGNCQLFFADLTTIGYLDKKAIRNWNVMYEIGIAHAVRLPEEVVLFKSDDDDLPFDLANVRVNKYDPDKKPDEAIDKVMNAIKYAFDEINLQKHLAVSRTAESLDFHSHLILMYIKSEQRNGVLKLGLEHLSDNPLLANSISRLLELGILRVQYAPLTAKTLHNLLEKRKYEELISYKITPFGSEVVNIFHNEAFVEGLKKASELIEG